MIEIITLFTKYDFDFKALYLDEVLWSIDDQTLTMHILLIWHYVPNLGYSHRQYIAALCMLYNIHPLFGALPIPIVSMRVTRGALTLSGILMHLSLQNLTVPLDIYTSLTQYLYEKFLSTACLMVWDWRVLRVGS